MNGFLDFLLISNIGVPAFVCLLVENLARQILNEHKDFLCRGSEHY